MDVLLEAVDPPGTPQRPARAPFHAGAGPAGGGAVLLGVGTVWHPAAADPADPVAAFAEYATTSRAAWVGSHLLQLAGLAGLALAMVLLVGALGGAGSGWARTTRACGAAALAAAAVLQAVDGVALKIAVDAWWAAPADERAARFAAALAVRALEVGLDGVFALVFAATAGGLGAVHLTAPAGRRVLGIVALVAAVLGATAGILFCLHGFSAAAMNLGLVALVLGVAVVVATALSGPGRGTTP